jgi:hypothetical protein
MQLTNFINPCKVYLLHYNNTLNKIIAYCCIIFKLSHKFIIFLNKLDFFKLLYK